MKPPKVFVGRKTELKLAIKLLRNGKSLVVEGQFGIGKTAFANIVAKQVMPAVPVYCSFEDDGCKIVESINRQLIQHYRRNGDSLSKQIFRFHQAAFGKKIVIVVDNIWRVTHQKISFFKRLNKQQNCQFVLVIETDDPTLRLKARTIETNHEVIKLGKLKPDESRQLLQRLTGHADGEINVALVRSSRGYPLGIVEMAQIILEKRSSHF